MGSLLRAFLCFASIWMPLEVTVAEEAPIRVAVLVAEAPGVDGTSEASEEEAGAGRGGSRDALRFARAPRFELRRVEAGQLDEATFDWMDATCVLDADRSDPGATLGYLKRAFGARKGLVIGQRAARALVAIDAGASWLGVERLEASERADEAGEERDSPQIVDLVDQTHSITQSLTAFRHRGEAPRLRLIAGAKPRAHLFRMLARAIEVPEKPVRAGTRLRELSPRPVLWTLTSGRAGRFRRGGDRALVCLLDAEDGPSADLVACLLARGLEECAGRRVTVELTGKYDVAARYLGAEDRGVFPGLEAEPRTYRGRRVAPVMGFGGADWLERPDRVKTEKPDLVVESLRLEQGQTVVDLGAGVGYFSLRLARAVGEQGRVLAVDVQKPMLDRLEERARQAGVGNITTVLSTETDPKLAEAASVDCVLMVDVYHELSKPDPVMDAVRRALRPTGRLVLVEYRGEDARIAIQPLHRTTSKQVEAELEARGFQLLEVRRFVPSQQVMFFGVGVAEKGAEGADSRKRRDHESSGS